MTKPVTVQVAEPLAVRIFSGLRCRFTPSRFLVVASSALIHTALPRRKDVGGCVGNAVRVTTR
jgi:hypothetical protein